MPQEILALRQQLTESQLAAAEKRGEAAELATENVALKAQIAAAAAAAEKQKLEEIAAQLATENAALKAQVEAAKK